MSDISVSKNGFYGRMKWIGLAKRQKVEALRRHGTIFENSLIFHTSVVLVNKTA
jgi:hypothetical protein